jgi:hypothetical protein
LTLLIFYKKVQKASVKKNNTEEKSLLHFKGNDTLDERLTMLHYTYTAYVFCAALSRVGKGIATSKSPIRRPAKYVLSIL